jgi:four helix bundle protein
MFKFAKLAVGQKSLNFAALIHAETPHFPPEERFGLTNRIRRAPAAVPSKIAEGSARSDADFSRFVGSAAVSRSEVGARPFIARRQKFLWAASFARIDTAADEIGRRLRGLRASLGD